MTKRRLYLAGLIFHAVLFIGWIWLTVQVIVEGEQPLLTVLRLGGLAYFGWMSVHMWYKWRRGSGAESQDSETQEAESAT